MTVILSFVVGACAQMTAQSGRNTGRNAEAKDMSLVGYNDLQARSAYQPVVHHQRNRFIAYIGLHGGSALNPLTGKDEPNGTVIVDVTDPRNPRSLAHIPGSAQGSGEAGGRKWCASATAKSCQRETRTKLICSVLSATRGMRSWMSLIRQTQKAQHGPLRTNEHAQKLVGVRHGDSLCRDVEKGRRLEKPRRKDL